MNAFDSAHFLSAGHKERPRPRVCIMHELGGKAAEAVTGTQTKSRRSASSAEDGCLPAYQQHSTLCSGLADTLPMEDVSTALHQYAFRGGQRARGAVSVCSGSGRSSGRSGVQDAPDAPEPYRGWGMGQAESSKPGVNNSAWPLPNCRRAELCATVSGTARRAVKCRSSQHADPRWCAPAFDGATCSVGHSWTVPLLRKGGGVGEAYPFT
mmetsp:Transcript_91562/g.158738  ORF Transcript_91562/g.158738 Transcript_91562/m.158738 type:complete len:210 (+) Transcript_91562:145-774(+)